MIKRILLWWYGECRSGAVIDELIHRGKMRKAQERIAHYEAKIGALQQPEKP